MKVAKLDIAYAKTAKKLDVKRLKKTIWNILTESDEDKVIMLKNHRLIPESSSIIFLSNNNLFIIQLK